MKSKEKDDGNAKDDRDKEDKLKLKPIDIKDVKKPEEYTGEPNKSKYGMKGCRI